VPEKDTDLTVEKIREQNRERSRRHYEKHKEAVKKDNRERYHRKKLDKELLEVQEGTNI
jgi:hypothetical protein